MQKKKKKGIIHWHTVNWMKNFPEYTKVNTTFKHVHFYDEMKHPGPSHSAHCRKMNEAIAYIT